jgi:uncharacterized membrane protein
VQQQSARQQVPTAGQAADGEAETYLGRSGPAGPRTEAIQAERFARGEIDEKEYRNRLRTLRGGQPT